MSKIEQAIRLCLVLAILGGNCLIANADESDKDTKDPDYIMDTSKLGQSDGVVRSDQLMELGSLTSGSLTMQGEQSLREGSIDRALTVLQRSVELAPLDIDARTLYAQTLEKKLMMEKDKKDPTLYNFIIKQWFFIYQKSDFFDQKMLGWSRIKTLTGTVPKRFEKPPKFLARVLIPEDGSVRVPLGGIAHGPTSKKLVSKKSLDPDEDFLKKDTVY